MMTLNPFVENNKARINQFLNNLCEVGDFYDTLEVITFITPPLYLMLIFSLCSKMDQYMALSKKDLMIHITLNELYHTLIDPSRRRDISLLFLSVRGFLY